MQTNDAEMKKQEQEQIDKIEVESQRTEQRELLTNLIRRAILEEEVFNLLSVEGDKSHEDKHACIGDNPVECRRGYKDVYHGGDNKAYKHHIEHVAHSREIHLGDISHKAHNEECTCGSEERCSDSSEVVDKE